MQQAVARMPGREAFHDRIGAPRNSPLCERRRGLASPRSALKTVGLMTMVGVAANFTMPMNKAQADGNFSATCKNIRLNAIGFSKTAVLTADCLKFDGRTYNHSSINLNTYITNNHGVLESSFPGGGDFQESCYSDILYYSIGERLSSTCSDGAGGFVRPPYPVNAGSAPLI
jgi:hypothetical protein